MLKNNSNSIFLIQFALLLNSATLLIPNKFKAYSIVLLLLVSIYNYSITKIEKKFLVKEIYFISILLFLYLLSIFYNFSFKEGFSRISTMSSMIVFPIIFSLLKSSNFILDIKFMKKIFLTFIFSNILFCVISFFYVWSLDEFTISSTFIHYSNSINKGLGLFSIHPIYLSLFSGISILMLIFLIKNDIQKKISKLLYLFLIFTLGVILAILMRKGSIIYVFISVTYLVFKLFDLKKTILAFIALLVITICSIQFIPKYENFNRFTEIFNSQVHENPSNSTGIRFNIYKCCLEKIKENFMFGYGVGNTQNQLDPCYLENGIDLSLKTYNSHNQYFSILLTIGVIGLVIYIFYVYRLFSVFDKNKNYLATGILIFFLLNFLTENIIERENGMILYSYFISIFIFYREGLETKS
jgi:O-antigen ligase